MRRVSKVDARDPLVLPSFTEGGLVIKEAEFLNDIVHNEVNVNYRLTSNVLLVSFAQLTHHVNSESLIRIKLEHAFYDAS